MKSYVLIWIGVLLLIPCITSSAQSRRKKKAANVATDQWRYDIECVSEASQGTYYVKVWSIVRTPKLAITQAYKNAIHGVLFKGYADNKESRCKGQRPLIGNIDIYHNNKKFFEGFFQDARKEGYNYMRFVVGAGEMTNSIKINKKEYKVAVNVVVQKDALRKHLEKAGIIRKLGLN